MRVKHKDGRTAEATQPQTGAEVSLASNGATGKVKPGDWLIAWDDGDKQLYSGAAFLIDFMAEPEMPGPIVPRMVTENDPPQPGDLVIKVEAGPDGVKVTKEDGE